MQTTKQKIPNLGIFIYKFVDLFYLVWKKTRVSIIKWIAIMIIIIAWKESFLVLCLKTFIPTREPSQPPMADKNQSIRSLILGFWYLAFSLSIPKYKKATTLIPIR